MADPTQEQTPEQEQAQPQEQTKPTPEVSAETKGGEQRPTEEDFMNLVAKQVSERLNAVEEQFKKQLSERDKKIKTLTEEAHQGSEELAGYKAVMKRVQDAFVGERQLTPGEEYEKEISPPEGVTDPEAVTMYKTLQRQRLAYEQMLSGLASELETSKTSLKSIQEAHEKDIEARKQAEDARQQAERGRFLSRLAVEEDAVDPIAVERMFGPSLEFQNGVLMYRNGKGELVDAETGVKADFPAYLRKPRGSAVGGSGSQGHTNQAVPFMAPGTEQAVTMNKEDIDKRLQTLAESIKNGRTDLLADYWAAERQQKEMAEAAQAA